MFYASMLTCAPKCKKTADLDEQMKPIKIHIEGKSLINILGKNSMFLTTDRHIAEDNMEINKKKITVIRLGQRS
jgi:hypothetical protein